ncbi:FliM/FliN family flagellar motor switch protein [Robbsia andropogonis]|uniref:FliM/FliN family flagellar motor switch protein n=1 Tax=Robbsia andropogonis TaxID=28092 RepID=UPI003D1D43C0
MSSGLSPMPSLAHAAAGEAPGVSATMKDKARGGSAHSKKWLSLRSTDGVRNVSILRAVLAMRFQGVHAVIRRPSSLIRYVTFSVFQRGYATTVLAEIGHCIAWRYPEATHYAWEALSDQLLFSILHREQWRDFIPAPQEPWERVQIEGVGLASAGMMIEITHEGIRYFYERTLYPLAIGSAAQSDHYAALARSCPVAISIEIGRTRMSIGLVDTLCCGDVIKIAFPAPVLRMSEYAAIPLSIAHGVLIVSEEPFLDVHHGQALPAAKSILDPSLEPEFAMNGEQRRQPSREFGLATLPVGLTFSFAPLTLTVAELSALQPGDVVPVAPGARLLIHVNGRQIGTGELVEVAGELAAEVLTLQLESTREDA